MQDRLAELRDGAPGFAGGEPVPLEEFAPSPSSNPLRKKRSGLRFRKSKKKKSSEFKEEEDDAAFMEDFFHKIKPLKDKFLQIREGTKSMEKLYTEILTSAQNAETHETLQKVINDTNMVISEVRNTLKEISLENKELGQDPDVSGSAEYHIRVNSFSTLKNKFLELVQAYQDVQIKFKNKEREKLENQIRIINPNATQAEMEEAVQSGDLGVVIAQQIGFDRQRAMSILKRVENQRNDLLSLEQSILELQQLFMDMALLVDTQGEMISNIEVGVNQTVGYTREAASELKQARKYQKKARNKMILIVTAVIAGIGGIFGSLFAAFK